MVTVNVLVKNEIEEIRFIGHSDFDICGRDIVCSAISSIVTTTVNAILMFDKNYIKYQKEKDKFVIKILVHNDLTIKLITNMLNLLKELENDYPRNIKIKEEIQ